MRIWWLRLTRYALPHWRELLFVVLLTLLGVALEMLKPWPVKLIVDSVVSKQSLPPAASWITLLPGDSATAVLGWLALGTILLFVANWVVHTLQSYAQASAGSRMAYDLGGDLFDHLQHLSLQFHKRQSIGDLMKRVTSDTGCPRDLVVGTFLPLFSSLVSIGLMFAVMWKLDAVLTLLAVLVAPLLGVVIWVFSKPMTERTHRQLEVQGDVMALAEQTLTALPVVKAFGREDHEDQRFSSLWQQSDKVYLRATASELQFRVGADTVIALGTAGLMLMGGLHVLQGKLSVGSLLVFISYLASLYNPLETIAYLSHSFVSAAAGARRVFDILDSKVEVRDKPATKALPNLHPEKRGRVFIENVTFGYEPDRSVLKDVTVEARSGETLALVGPTGAGKSTLMSLIPRFVDPWEGKVTIDGIDVREVQLASLRQQVSLVLQEPFLLPMSVAENIAYGRPEATPQKIREAALAAHADEFIQKLPQGYDTLMSERGATLSGGQRQMLAIARALLKDAPILILDEPTSSLDAQTEALFLEALNRLMKGRTTLVIAHRLSTIRRADRIVVLDNGRVAETGTHHDLMRARSLYYRLHQNQFGDITLAVAGGRQ